MKHANGVKGNNIYDGFVVFTAVTMKSYTRRLRGTYYFHLAGRRVKQTVKQSEASFILCSSEISTNFHHTTELYIPEERILQVQFRL
jgi:hypothetical protein